MLKTIDLFDLLVRHSFVYERTEYEYAGYANHMIQFVPKAAGSARGRSRTGVPLRDLVCSQQWQVKRRHSSETVSVLLTRSLEIARHQLQRRVLSFGEKNTKHLLGKALGGDKDLILNAKTKRLLDARKIDELIKHIEDDLAVLRSTEKASPRRVLPPNVTLKTAPPINVAEASFMPLVHRDRAFADHLEDVLRKNDFIFKTKSGDALHAFLRFTTEAYLTTHLGGLRRDEQNAAGTLAVSFAPIPKDASYPTGWARLLGSVERGSKAAVVEEGALVVAYFALNVWSGPVLCQVALASGGRRAQKRWPFGASRPLREYVAVLADVRFGLQDFLEKHDIFSISMAIKRLIELLDETKSNPNPKTWSLTNKYLIKIVDYCTSALSGGLQLDHCIAVCYDVRQVLSLSPIALSGAALDNLTKRFRALVGVDGVAGRRRGNELVAVVFDILRHCASPGLVRQVSQALDDLRLGSTRRMDTSFRHLAFAVFEKKSWAGTYSRLTEKMCADIKEAGLNFMALPPGSIGEVRRLPQRKALLLKLLDTASCNATLSDADLDPALERIIDYARKNVAETECLDTIKALGLSARKFGHYKKLCQVRWGPDARATSQPLPFLDVFLDKNWVHTDTEFILAQPLQKKLARIVFDALESLVDTEQWKQDIAFNLKVLEDLRIDVREELRIWLVYTLWLPLFSWERNMVAKTTLVDRFVKNEEKTARHLAIVAMLYADSSKKNAFDAISKIIMSGSKFLDAHFVLTAFWVFTNPLPSMPAGLRSDIKAVFLKTFNDPLLSRSDVAANERVLEEELGIKLTDADQDVVVRDRTLKIKTLVDRWEG